PENSSEALCDENTNEYEIGDVITQILEDGTQKEYTIVGKIWGYRIIPSYNENQITTLLDRTELKSTDIVNITIISNNLQQIYNDYYDIYYMLKANRDPSINVDDMAKHNTSLLEYANVLDYTSDFQKNVYALEGIF